MLTNKLKSLSVILTVTKYYSNCNHLDLTNAFKAMNYTISLNLDDRKVFL